MKDATAGFQAEGYTAHTEGADLAYFDLDAEARILSRNAVAQQFLNANPHYVTYITYNGAEVFTVTPIQPFLQALKSACDRFDPVSTVLSPINNTEDPLLQINVLPLCAGVARIVLFWSSPEIGAEEVTYPKLTARERAVLELAASGLRRDRIAHRLNISLPTVDMHSRNLRRKLSVMTTVEAVAVAIRMRLLEA
ncbi:helix-turn-helix transcriptional regulator [Celeribacter halophilus]|uniref:Helix-turn-helix transcriptional regulator n=1 Tax=Celeribacter halophilus TaxID=576117 RepID=A0AAW7XWV7_9RHOB|nr:helix-turn-helix transcriptional regulator [Celeribacter halophilus]MBU2888878.1 helix-turn-helix transcriptional regulator [Celeribacter halophilus]MDO6458470.1 helix-turn-helix transcriptional regulator [Celeribacter halophilus]MDO6511996.1 helix-turn-helix transcriptional regulator [Celeribacter halophilus]